MEEMLLKDLTFPDKTSELIHKWIMVQHGDVRVYYKPNDEKEKSGFLFYVVKWMGVNADSEGIWDIDTCMVECQYWGIAYFDNIRHLYMGDKETSSDGYINYPHTSEHEAIFGMLKKLESQYCQYCQE